MLRTIRHIGWLSVLLLLVACGGQPGPEPGGQGEGRVETPATPVPLSSSDSYTAFELQNTSQQTLEWRIEVDHEDSNPQSGDWFTVSPDEGSLHGGEVQMVTLRQSQGAAPGSYTSTLAVVYPGGQTLLEVTGQVDADSDWEEGEGAIEGTLRTDNALVPINPPDVGGGTFSTASAAAEGPDFVPNQLVVALDDSFRSLSSRGHSEPLLELAAEFGASIQGDPLGERVVLEFPEGTDLGAVADRFEELQMVRFVEPNHVFRLHAVPNDPLINRSWQLPVLGAPVAWDAPAAASMPVVAVIDSGFDLDHEDLRATFVSNGFDFCASSGCGSTDGDVRPEDPFFNTHGTHVTGLLGAVSDNGRGIAGVAGRGARIVPIKVFYDDQTTETAVADAIRWAAGGNVQGVPRNSNPARIINMSLGAVGDSRLVREAVQFAQDQGALIIASAGNTGEQGIDYPAAYPDVIAVGSINSAFDRSCFSDYGSELDIMAPGGDGYLCSAPRDEGLLSTFPQDDYGIDAGTSMAAPLVSGAAAVVWASNSNSNADWVRERLLASAYFDSDYMSETRYGSGILRLDRALGFPGPGDSAAVQAVGPSNALDTVELNLTGTSETYRLAGLAPGTYSIEAEAVGRSRELRAVESLEVPGSGTATLTIDLE